MRRIFLLLSFLLIISKITAEVPVAVIISGASPVNVGETKNYAAYSSTTIFAPAWTVTGGTIVNTGYDAAEMTYWANIQWDVVGNQTVNLKSKWLVVGSKAVTVNDPIDPPTANNESNKTTNSFRANWSNVSGASSYRLDVSVSSGFGSYVSGYQDLSVTGTNKTVSGLAVGKNYYYRVRAVGSSTSVNSNTITANTTISAPTANQESSKTTSSFKANWGSVSGAVSYRLDVSKFSNFQSFESGYNNLTVTGTNKTVSGLGSGKIYYYRVRARGSNITSGNSGIITANTTFQIPTVNSTSSITNDSFQANWTTSPLVACRLDVSEVSNFSSYVSGYQDILVSGGTGTMQQTINGLV
ncbi:MAG: hypothetical protein GY816_13125, partial [Cytophagales bacterium]|nr:hypothetical protein [Cytophagales bacterium]